MMSIVASKEIVSIVLYKEEGPPQTNKGKLNWR